MLVPRVALRSWLDRWLVMAARCFLLALVFCSGFVLATDLPLRFEVAGAAGVVRVFADTPEDGFDAFVVERLRGTHVSVGVSVDGVTLGDGEASSVVEGLLDALQVWRLARLSDVWWPVRNRVGVQMVRGDPRYDVVFPGTVELGTRHANWLLGGGVGNPGLDDVAYRTRLWRDTILDLALLGVLHSELGRGDELWFEGSGDARLDVWVRDAAVELERVAGVVGIASEAPQRLVDVVNYASAAGVAPEVVQGVLDRTMPGLGLRAAAFDSHAAAAQGSPFSTLQEGLQQVGLVASVFALGSRLTTDAFDALALQLALNEDAERRLRLIEGVVARQACDATSQPLDPALCDGVRLARTEFEALQQSVWRGLASVFVTSDTIIDYLSLATSITGQVAGLVSSNPAAAAAVKGAAGVVGGGLYVVGTVVSILDEGVPLRRAFLIAQLNELLFRDQGIADPAADGDVEAWLRSVEVFALAQVVEFAYFSYLRSGYTGRFGDGTYALHALTQALHRSGSIVREVEALEARALAKIVEFQPLSASVQLQPVRAPRPTHLFFDDFADRDYTRNPTWTPRLTDNKPVRVTVEDGYARFLSSGNPGRGGGAGLEIEVDIRVTDTTVVSFDAIATLRTVGDGCGWTCREYPANLQLTLEDSDRVEYVVRYAVNYGTALQDQTDGRFKQVTTRVEQATWQRDLEFRIRDAWPQATRITAIRIFAGGWDYDGGIDNVRVWE